MKRFTIAVCVTAILLTMAAPMQVGDADGPLRRLRNRVANFVRPANTNYYRSTARWTVAGGEHNIQNHLAGWPHNVDTTGWTHQQRLNYHDNHHDVIGPVSGRQIARNRTVVTPRRTKQVTRQSYCPACPQNTRIVTYPVAQQTTQICENGVCYTPVQPTVIPKAERPFTPEFVESRVRDEMRGDNTFRRELVKAIKSQRKSGQLTGRQAVRLRTALLSPAFLKEAQTLAVTQMSFSGQDSANFETDDNDNIVETSINWEGLTNFLVTILPLISDLLIQFGLGA